MRIVTLVTIEGDLATLTRNGWFARQPERLRHRLLAAGQAKPLARGQWVYSEGDAQTGLCAVLDGTLRLEVTAGGDRDVLIGVALPATILGQTRRRGGGPRIITVRASGAARVLLVSDEALGTIAADEPDLWRAVNELVYAQLDAMTHLAAQLLVQRPAARVAARLLQYAQGDRVAINQADLAEMCGLSRKTAAVHLAEFEGAGAIVRGYRAITIRDAVWLERVVTG